jgi:ADP-ribose pyrophosphatase YjhB (NUDIX family)
MVAGVTREITARITGANLRAVGACVVLRDDGDRVLLVEAGVLNRGWDLPGGKLERGETPDQGAAREAREETGLDVEVGRLVMVDVKRRRKVVFVFAGRILGGELAAAPGEIHGIEWWTEAEIGSRRLKSTGRIREAVAAEREGRTVYRSRTASAGGDGNDEAPA